ncbi:uncharacterized protein FFFS_07980 [Fusarium fujikuroi]|nr:uncharacterized protein FFFS_07980 [Fusarium fujikuroi]
MCTHWQQYINPTDRL